MVSSSRKSKVVIVSPALRETNNGNWQTAHRWAQFLSSQPGTRLLDGWSGSDEPSAGVMIALHARRSAPAIHAWARENPGKPLVVVLTCIMGRMLEGSGAELVQRPMGATAVSGLLRDNTVTKLSASLL